MDTGIVEEVEELGHRFIKVDLLSTNNFGALLSNAAHVRAARHVIEVIIGAEPAEMGTVPVHPIATRPLQQPIPFGERIPSSA